MGGGGVTNFDCAGHKCEMLVGEHIYFVIVLLAASLWEFAVVFRLRLRSITLDWIFVYSKLLSY